MQRLSESIILAVCGNCKISVQKLPPTELDPSSLCKFAARKKLFVRKPIYNLIGSWTRAIQPVIGPFFFSRRRRNRSILPRSLVKCDLYYHCRRWTEGMIFLALPSLLLLMTCEALFLYWRKRSQCVAGSDRADAPGRDTSKTYLSRLLMNKLDGKVWDGSGH